MSDVITNGTAQTADVSALIQSVSERGSAPRGGWGGTRYPRADRPTLEMLFVKFATDGRIDSNSHPLCAVYTDNVVGDTASYDTATDTGRYNRCYYPLHRIAVQFVKAGWMREDQIAVRVNRSRTLGALLLPGGPIVSDADPS